MSKPNLIYKTKGNQSPQGKSKVYFTCAEEDFDKYFEKETNEILHSNDNIDCAIFYNGNINYRFENNDEKKEYFSLLDEMNLIVIPVTSNFLKCKSRAFNFDFKYAKLKNIPLLMIMEEPNLDALFEAKCDKTQYLDRFQDTSTQESFEDKLKKFLNNTLISNELAQKIRDSFDAYIFLSYRKKDRKEALEVMREIHSNDFTRDIAIWFDENLIPGENFSDAIKEALEKSELFAMVVTPNVNESPNYIMNEEYPNALISDKNILPIEAIETNKDELNDNYFSIPDVVNINDTKTLSEKLLQLLHKEAYKGNNDPEHLYYIGLAYLEGIDVERNAEKGIEILNSSADLEYLPSLKKLVSIYEKGERTKVNYPKAIDYQFKIIDIAEKLSINKEEILSYKNKLANLFNDNGEYQEALQIHEEVYEKRKEILGENHPNTLDSLHNLSNSYSDLGDYTKALELGEKVYEKRKEILGENHPDTLASLNNLASSYSNLGNYIKALELDEKVYEKSKEILGEYHPDTLTSLNNLANSYTDLGNYTKALELYEKAYEKYKEILGENHPNTLSSLNNLAVSYSDLGNHTKALELNEKVYEKRKEILGEYHPDTLTSLNNLALSHNDLGNYTEALELFKEVYEKYKEILGENHPNTLSSLNNLANSYTDLGDYTKALELYEKAYEKQTEILGEYHPNTLRSLHNLANSYSGLGDYTKALELREKVYEKYKETLGENHPDTLASLNNLASSYSNLGNYIKALELDEKVYEKRKEILGENHPDTLSSLSGIANSYYYLGNYAKALEIYEEVYEKRKEILGEDHPATQKSLRAINILKQSK